MASLNTVWIWLQGKKSYVVSLAAILYAVAEYWQGAYTQQQMVAAILAALGLSALRNAVSTASKQTTTEIEESTNIMNPTTDSIEDVSCKKK